MSKDKINNYLKQKYKLYKQITNFIKNNLSIKEDAFQEFLEFDAKECTQSDLIKLLDKTTYEINEYVDNYDELLKNQEFLKLKRELYDIEINLEATSEYYNNKIIIYNNLKQVFTKEKGELDNNLDKDANDEALLHLKTVFRNMGVNIR